MAGTLTISTLSDGTYSTSATNLVRGACQAWVRTNTVTSIIGSYNVSSITLLSTGKYAINLTNALVDANYAAFITTQNTATNPGGNNFNESTTSTSSVCYFAHYEGASLTNTATLCVAIFR